MVLKGYDSKALRIGDDEPAPLEAGQSRLYNMRFCPFSESVVLYLSKKQIPAQVINIHPVEIPEWYCKVHPDGLVPAFEHAGKVLTKPREILEYLDETYPDSSILPKDAVLRENQMNIADCLEFMIELPTSNKSNGFLGLPKNAFSWTVSKFRRKSTSKVQKNIDLRKLLIDVRDKSLQYRKCKEAEKYLSYVERFLCEHVQHSFLAGKEPGYPDYLLLPIIEVFTILAYREFCRIPQLTSMTNPLYRYAHHMVDEIMDLNRVAASDKIKYWEAYLGGKEINPDLGLPNVKKVKKREESARTDVVLRFIGIVFVYWF